MHPSSSRAFQGDQERDLKHPGSVDLIDTKQKKNKQTTLLYRYTFHPNNNKAHKLVILYPSNWVFTFEYIRSLLLGKEFSDFFFLFLLFFCLGVMDQRRQTVHCRHR